MAYGENEFNAEDLTSRYAGDITDLLFERMPMGMLVLSPDFHILRFNTTWSGFFEKYSPQTAHLVQPGSSSFDVLPPTRATLKPIFERVLQGKTIREPELCLITAITTTYLKRIDVLQVIAREARRLTTGELAAVAEDVTLFTPVP